MSGGLGIPLIDFSDLRQSIGGLAKLGQQEEAQRLLGQQLDAALAAQGQQSAALAPLGSAAPAAGVLGAPAAPKAGSLPFFARAQGAAPTGKLAPLIADVATRNEINPGYLQKLVQVESGGNPNAVSSTGAKGLAQFIPSTAKAYGLTDPFDPAANLQAAARLTLDNKASLSRVLGREPSDGELYLAHQQGAGGAAKILANPNATMAQLGLGRAAAVNGGSPSMLAGDFAQKWVGRFDGMSGGAAPAARVAQAAPAVPAPAPAAVPAGMPSFASAPAFAGAVPATAPQRAAPGAPAQAAAAADMPAPGAQPVAGFAIPGTGQVVPAPAGNDFTPGAVASPALMQPSAAGAASLAPAAAQRITPAQAQNLRAMLANPLTQGYAAKIIEGLNKPSEFSFQVVGDQLVRTSKDGRVEVVPNINKPPTFSVTKGSDGNDYVFNPQTGALTSAIKGRDTTVRTVTDPGERASLGLGDYKGPVQLDADGKMLAPFRPTTEVNVNQGAEKAQAAKIGGAYGDTFNDMQKSGRDAAGQLNTLRLMEKLIDNPNFYSGSGGNQVLAFRRAAASLGIAGADTAAPQELFSKLANQSIIDKLGGNLGAGVSNSDVTFMSQTTANLANTPEGNRQIVRFGKALAERQIEVAKLAREYAKGNNGLLDAGFDDRLAAYARANPLFPEATDAQQAAAARPAPAATPRPAAQAAPGPAAAPPGAPRQGQTATNPQTKERLIFDNGKWVPFT